MQLLAYSGEYQNEIVYKIADFFGFHRSLFESNIVVNDNNFEMAKENINTWTSEGHSFHIIILDDKLVGFLHIGYRGGNVAWIEDIYVDKNKRGQGIASQAIHLAEEVIKQRKDYTAICFDVVPRNYDALKLYYRLGYTNVSIITARKELYGNEYDKKINLFDFEFNY